MDIQEPYKLRNTTRRTNTKRIEKRKPFYR